MYNRCYVSYTKEGIQTIIDYSNNCIVDDKLREMMRANKNGSIFEDLLEAIKSTAFWF
jgi:hypothetical protein